ncbi:MAG: NAD(P)-binding domain-containing protein [Pseudomonadota bacterium]
MSEVARIISDEPMLRYADADERLARLSDKVRLDLDRMDFPPRDWVRPLQHASGEPVYDVAIIGAGQGGLAAALALWRERVRNIIVLDKAEEGTEGPWVSFARMKTLRTPKYLTGPDTGIPDLTFMAWYAAQYPQESWQELDRIPRRMWMAYLRWLRALVPAEIRSGTEVTTILPDGAGFLALKAGGEIVRARRVILANGIEGCGRWEAPAELTEPIPSDRWMHASDPRDLSFLRGARVGVLGYGASAVDCAATAAETGADVHLFFRRRTVSTPERRAWIETTGFLRHYADMTDAQRWRAMHAYFTAGSPPPTWSLQRLIKAGASLHPAQGWLASRPDGSGVSVKTPDEGWLPFDFLIFGTGLRVDPDLRPELAAFHGQIACWEDRYTPPNDLIHGPMGRYPYLDDAGALTERHPGKAPHLSSLYVFNWGATLSLGISSSSITGMKFGLSRIVPGLTRSLWLEQADDYIADFPGTG